MKTVLVLSILLCAAFAAPAEQQAPEVAVEALNEQMAAAPVMEEEMMPKEEEVLVAEDSVPVSNEVSPFSLCPDGWYNFESRCFKPFFTSMSWYNAEEHCNFLGAHLASVTNPRELRFLQETTHNNAWLGGFYLQGRWLWIDREGFYYNNWVQSSPITSYPCTYLRTTNGWGNTRCSDSLPFVCSKRPSSC